MHVISSRSYTRWSMSFRSAIWMNLIGSGQENEKRALL